MMVPLMHRQHQRYWSDNHSHADVIPLESGDVDNDDGTDSVLLMSFKCEVSWRHARLNGHCRLCQQRHSSQLATGMLCLLTPPSPPRGSISAACPTRLCTLYLFVAILPGGADMKARAAHLSASQNGINALLIQLLLLLLLHSLVFLHTDNTQSPAAGPVATGSAVQA